MRSHQGLRSPRPPRAADGAGDLLRRVGGAVRAARRDRGLSRRALAAASGVSERFLAQIESGRCNVSLVRLDAVARALETPLAWLIAPPAPEGPRVALIGLRGAGKSTVGRRLARLLRAPFLELDGLIEEAAGLPLGQIFEIHGERYFRRLERQVLARLASSEGPGVLAVGGSLVTDPETYALLRSRYTTVWLSAAPGDHYARVLAQGDRRPMAGKPDAMAEIEALLRARRPLYRLADHTVDTSRTPPAAAARRIAEAVRPVGATAPRRPLRRRRRPGA